MTNKSFLRILHASLLGLASSVIQPVLAVSSIETDATYNTTSDPVGPVTTGSILSEVIVPGSDGTSSNFSGDAYARGAADDSGAGAVAVDAAFFNGSSTLNTLTGLSILTSDITNDTGGLASFSYDFFLPGPQLSIVDFAGMSDADNPTITAFFDFRVSLDYGSGYLPFVVSQGQLQGGLVSHTLGTAGTNPLGSTFFTDSNFPNNIFGYQFNSFEDTINGILAEGQSLSVQTSLFVSLAAPGFETGGTASIGDPLNLTSAAFSDSLTISAIPVPAAVWLFGSGLISLVGFAKRKKA